MNSVVVFLLVFTLLGSGFFFVSIQSGFAENTYNTSEFKTLNISAAWPHYGNEDDLIFIHGLKQDGNITWGIWFMNDTTPKHLLYADDSIDYTFTGPTFSSDETSIVFTEGAPLSIIMLEQNGTQWDDNCISRIVFERPKGALKTPSFSPDGRQLIFYSIEYRDRHGDAWVMDVDGTNRTRLASDNKGGMSPSFSPDGSKIVYERWSGDGGTEIWIMNANGTGKKRICDDSWYPGNPCFMPDGKILFDSARYSPHSKGVSAPSIWMMEQDGSNRTLLVPSVITSLGSERPTINGQGTRIAFEHGLGDSLSIYYVEDPDRDGVWEDSDGDHVADICDGYPNDPNRGYYVDDEEDQFLGFGFETVSFSILCALVLTWRKREERGR